MQASAMGLVRHLRDQEPTLLQHLAGCLDHLRVTDTFCLREHLLQIGRPAAETSKALSFPIFHRQRALAPRKMTGHT